MTWLFLFTVKDICLTVLAHASTALPNFASSSFFFFFSWQGKSVLILSLLLIYTILLGVISEEGILLIPKRGTLGPDFSWMKRNRSPMVVACGLVYLVGLVLVIAIVRFVAPGNVKTPSLLCCVLLYLDIATL